MLCLLQRVFGPPVHPDSPGGAGVQPGTVAAGRQPAAGARHLLLLQRHGAVHQRARPADRGAQGQRRTDTNKMSGGSARFESHTGHRDCHWPNLSVSVVPVTSAPSAGFQTAQPRSSLALPQ